MIAQTPHARPHAHQGDTTAQTAQTAHPPVRGCGVAYGVVAARTTPSQTSSLDHVAAAAFQLLRLALLAKLAVDLQDPVLARRAARLAVLSAQHLAEVEFPAGVDDQGQDDQDDDPDEDAALPDVDDLLERMPSRHDVDTSGGGKRRDEPPESSARRADDPRVDKDPREESARYVADGRTSAVPYRLVQAFVPTWRVAW